MKLSFSTRGWFDLDWTALTDIAAEMGFGGIEVYNLMEDALLYEKGAAFHPVNISATLRALRENSLELPCFDTSYDLAAEASPLEKLQKIIRVAERAGTPYVACAAYGSNEDLVRSRLRELIPIAEEKHVTLLLRTSGIYADTARMRSLLDEFACDQLAALWDVHHPLVDFAESADTTIKNLGAYVKHVHLTDADRNGDYAIIGEGDSPIEDIICALDSIDFGGYVSLEWKSDWNQDALDYEVVFPHFVNYMSRFAASKRKHRKLYPNHDGTGRYIWKKFELIDLTFPQVLDTLVKYFPDQYCFKYTTLDYTRTYEEFRRDVDHFARALISLGVKAGSKVAIWATNVPAWYITFWAATKIGAVLVTVNTAYKISEVEYLLRQSDTHTLVTIESALDSNYKEIINELCPELEGLKPGEPLHSKRLPFLRNVITVDFKQKGCLTFDEVMNRYESTPKKVLRQMAAKIQPDDVCNMQYTSGTTGFPKGVMLTHYNVLNDGKCIGDRMGLSTADRMMIQVPMFHCFGMVLSMTSSMTHGTTMCPMPYFSAKSSLSCINREHITCFNGVPTMFIAMFNHPDYRSTDFSYMRTGIMAGAGCPPELMRRAAEPGEMNMTGIVSVYGQTESSPGSTMSAWEDSLELRTETVGYAFPHVECKVIDPNTGDTLPDGENGEFCSRGYNTMKGYYKMPQATMDTIDAEGWLHSGDLACRNPDGTYRITGRLKDMIIRGGENIYPKEIEEFIYTHPDVKDVQVIGVPDKKYGEEAMAMVIKQEGADLTEEELRTYIAANIARHKMPKYIEFTDHFPMNAAGKVLKYKMREDAVKRLQL